MSNAAVGEMTEERVKSNERFLKERQNTERFIQRHSKQARWTHGIAVTCCILLCISGLFVFVPPLAALVGSDVVFFFRMCHRVFGVIFVVVPLVSAIAAPKGVAHIFKELFAKWDSDDKKWMILFFPYLFMAKWIHMPDQSEEKSGQRFADGMLWLFGLEMAVTGVLLLLGELFFTWPGTAHMVLLFLHDLGFLMIAVFGMAHIFLGAGIFQPYRGTYKLMFGNGQVSESDAIYHWGHWARKVITEGDKIVEKPAKRK